MKRFDTSSSNQVKRQFVWNVITSSLHFSGGKILCCSRSVNEQNVCFTCEINKMYQLFLCPDPLFLSALFQLRGHCHRLGFTYAVLTAANQLNEAWRDVAGGHPPCWGPPGRACELPPAHTGSSAPSETRRPCRGLPPRSRAPSNSCLEFNGLSD